MKETSIIIGSLEELAAFSKRVVQGVMFSDHHPDEQQVIAAILPAMCERLNFSFPLTICHRDKPDFLLGFAEYDIAVEVVRFLAPQLGHATDTARRMKSSFNPSRYHFVSPSRTRDEMEKSILAPSVGLEDWQPIFNRQYVEEIRRIVEEKRQKVLVANALKVKENWLLISDDHDMQGLTLGFVVKVLLEKLEVHWKSRPHFSKILIFSGSTLVDLNSTAPAWITIEC